MTATWSAVPVVVIPRSRCPHCGDLAPPHIYRSQAGGDGSTTRRCICRRCSRRYEILIDPDELPVVLSPATGKAAPPT
jgi:transcriptional regulator NrdR family protein